MRPVSKIAKTTRATDKRRMGAGRKVASAKVGKFRGRRMFTVGEQFRRHFR
jgi:hypothetical protein